MNNHSELQQAALELHNAALILNQASAKVLEITYPMISNVLGEVKEVPELNDSTLDVLINSSEKLEDDFAFLERALSREKKKVKTLPELIKRDQCNFAINLGKAPRILPVYYMKGEPDLGFILRRDLTKFLGLSSNKMEQRIQNIMRHYKSLFSNSMYESVHHKSNAAVQNVRVLTLEDVLLVIQCMETSPSMILTTEEKKDLDFLKEEIQSYLSLKV